MVTRRTLSTGDTIRGTRGTTTRLAWVVLAAVCCTGQSLAWAQSLGVKQGVPAPQTDSGTEPWRVRSTMPLISVEDRTPNPPRQAGRANAARMYLDAWMAIDGGIARSLDDSANPNLDADLIANQKYVEELLRATETPECDWGIRYEDGYEALLPQLGVMRHTARVLRNDALRLLDSNDEQTRSLREQAAVRRLSALWRMPNHLNKDRIIISGLVGAAIAALGEATVKELLHDQALSVDGAQQILGVVRSFAARKDVYGLREGVLGERDLSVPWLRRTFASTEAGAHAGQKFVDHFSRQTELPEILKNALRSMDATALARELDRFDTYYDRVYDVWDDADAPASVASLDQDVRDGEYGPLVQLLAPNLERAVQSDARATAELASLQALLQRYIDQGGVLREAADQSDLPKDRTTKPADTK